MERPSSWAVIWPASVEAVDAFTASATTAGLGADRPTTPDWDVRRLVAHQGLVHRWATAVVLRRARSTTTPSSARGWRSADPVGLAPRRRRPAGRRDRGGPGRPRGPGLPRRRRRRRSGSGPGGSATRPPSMPSTRCRPRSAATPAPATPGSHATSPSTASTSCSPASCRGRARALRSDDPMTIAVLPDDADAALAGHGQPQRPPVTARGRRRRGRRRRAARARRSRSTSPCGTAATRSATTGLDLWAEGARVTWA